MNFDLKVFGLSAAATEKCDLLVVLVPEGFAPSAAHNALDTPNIQNTPDTLSTLVVQALKNGDLQTKPGKNLHCYQISGVAARRVILAGVGKGKATEVRQALLALASVWGAGSTTIKRAVVCFAGIQAQGSAIAAAVSAIFQTSYVYTATKSKAKAKARSLNRVVLGINLNDDGKDKDKDKDKDIDALTNDFERSVAIATGVELAREWGNRPANYATPTLLANAAKELAKLPNIQCKIMGPTQVAKLGMGAFMAVAQGSKEELRFIELRYNGHSGGTKSKAQAPVVLVGKGITFDTGGISIKPAPEMDEMKFDMCGAASVLGVFRALAELQPAINVVGLIPACENMPDGLAIKPGDVVTSMGGQTIEILNTDAEGRLLLCDALTYAARFKPAAIIDIATLTGACVIALGGVRSGMFSSDEGLAAALLAAGEEAQDLCWRLPLDEDYAEGLKTNFADMANVAGRPGGAITAAKFLQRFAGEQPWAHLDIAGTAWKGGAAKGATGRPVGLLVHYLLQRLHDTPATND